VAARRAHRITRDAVLVTVGIALLVFEALRGSDRPGIITAAVTLCFGLPFTLWADRIGRGL
jgi:hypothetical protein